jgi:hypothetical protein
MELVFQAIGDTRQALALAYGRAFGWLWWIPFSLRYVRRVWSRLPGPRQARNPNRQDR